MTQPDKLMNKSLIGSYQVEMDGDDEDRFLKPARATIEQKAKQDGLEISHFVYGFSELTNKHLIAGIIKHNG